MCGASTRICLAIMRWLDDSRQLRQACEQAFAAVQQCWYWYEKQPTAAGSCAVRCGVELFMCLGAPGPSNEGGQGTRGGRGGGAGRGAGGGGAGACGSGGGGGASGGGGGIYSEGSGKRTGLPPRKAGSSRLVHP